MLDTSIELLENLKEDALEEWNRSRDLEVALEKQLAEMQDNLEWRRSNTLGLQERYESLVEAITVLEGAKQAPQSDDTENYRDSSGELASWEIALLSPFSIGQKVVVLPDYPRAVLHGRILTVSQIVRNPNILDGHEYYAHTEEGHNIWVNFLSAVES